MNEFGVSKEMLDQNGAVVPPPEGDTSTEAIEDSSNANEGGDGEPTTDQPTADASQGEEESEKETEIEKERKKRKNKQINK